jgi:hypothetical protein
MLLRLVCDTLETVLAQPIRLGGAPVFLEVTVFKVRGKNPQGLACQISTFRHPHMIPMYCPVPKSSA